MTDLTNDEVHHALLDAAAVERKHCADILAYLGEIEARGLHASAGYDTMEQFCIEELHMDEEDLSDRIYAASIAHEFPSFFPAIEDGRLDVRGVCILGAALSENNAEELIAAASHRTHDEIERLVEQR